MKNILAENMRRFGTKNLQEQDAEVAAANTAAAEELTKQLVGKTLKFKSYADESTYEFKYRIKKYEDRDFGADVKGIRFRNIMFLGEFVREGAEHPKSGRVNAPLFGIIEFSIHGKGYVEIYATDQSGNNADWKNPFKCQVTDLIWQRAYEAALKLAPKSPYGTKNLTEQEANVQTLTGKQLRKHGYKVPPGSLPIQDQDQYVVDPALRVVSQIQSAGEMALTTKLTPEQMQLLRMRKARIIFRDTKNGNVELQYVELAK